ncbi:MAG: 30S ribosomal protein S20 [Candidatus Peribacteraceae bacterium]
MPVLSASIKDARQAKKRTTRRQPFKTSMKTQIRKIGDLVKAGKTDEATKTLPAAFKAIDTAAKKNIIHWKNAAKKKSQLSKMVAAKK